MLGIYPMSSGDVGELTSAGRNGVNVAPERRRHQRAFWSITDTDDDTDPEDGTGFASLRKLVARLAPHVNALADLRRTGETIIWWSGDSDSTQGGFVLEADLIVALAGLGCPVYGTAYLSKDDEDD